MAFTPTATKVWNRGEDLDAAADFYTRVLGLEIYARVAGRHVFFRCGQAVFLVFNPEKTKLGDSRPPAHGASGPSMGG